jgi:cytochrome c553
MPGDDELKIPDGTFRNRNGESESFTAANPLRTNEGIRRTARRIRERGGGVRPVGLYFFSAILSLGALRLAGFGHPAISDPSTSTGRPAPVSTATPAPPAGADLFRSTVRPVLLAHCAPCHEPGGKMYERLPFENPQVVADHRAGVLRRLKGDDRASVEKWLAALPPASPTP